MTEKCLPKKIKRVVVKVGTSILTSKAGQLDKSQIKNIVLQICSLLDKKIEVILVTSGAIGAGMGLLKLKSRPQTLPRLQAVAAIGQTQLMEVYDALFKSKKRSIAQVLLTSEDLVDRKRYLNAKNTLLTLLGHDVVPIINENDTVAVDEIKYGDNDTLAALVTNLVEADHLIILSDVDGLYKDKELVSEVCEITPEIKKLAKDTRKAVSVGGMITKIQAANTVSASGITCIFANGRTKDVLTKIIIEGKDIGTKFLPKRNRMAAKKHWIIFTSKAKGKIIVDLGAKEALAKRGKSLLASGIAGVKGSFKVGDIISIVDSQGREFARGQANYTSGDLEKIKGLKTSEIKPVLGYKDYDEVVHRDNLAML